MIDILNIPLYKTTIVMIVESTPEEWENFYHLYEDKLTEDDYKCILKDIEDPSICDGATIVFDKGDYGVFIRHKDRVGDIAHEIFHVANKILCSRGVYHESDGEAWAYLIGYITEEFYKMLENKDD